ncbi:hypothetical protein [Trueperella abortisuis]|uniref:hypothetical protein n=1 Tax=Trueperella abortisuis TaxID=445930 RepID=UPI002892F735|nr:hypothetical protein [Trueperella abortisuis]
MTSLDLAKAAADALAAPDQPFSCVQSGDNNVQVGHADALNVYQQFAAPQREPLMCPVRDDYFHVLVGDVPARQQQGTLTFSPSQILDLSSTSRELFERYRELDADSIDELKLFPAIIASENQNYGRASATQFAGIGVITDIRLLRSSACIDYLVCDLIGQNSINDLCDELDLRGNKVYTELAETHWALKERDLVGVLHAAGIQLEGFTANTQKVGHRG